MRGEMLAVFMGRRRGPTAITGEVLAVVTMRRPNRKRPWFGSAFTPDYLAVTKKPKESTVDTLKKGQSQLMLGGPPGVHLLDTSSPMEFWFSDPQPPSVATPLFIDGPTVSPKSSPSKAAQKKRHWTLKNRQHQLSHTSQIGVAVRETETFSVEHSFHSATQVRLCVSSLSSVVSTQSSLHASIANGAIEVSILASGMTGGFPIPPLLKFDCIDPQLVLTPRFSTFTAFVSYFRWHFWITNSRCSSSLLAEVLAVRLGLVMAFQWRLVSVTIITDAKVVVEAIYNPDLCIPAIQNPLTDVKLLMSRFVLQGPMYSLDVVLSLETALKASKQIHHIKITSKPDSVLGLLRNYGLTNTHFAKLITTLPSLLSTIPIKTLKPKMGFFRNNGISDPILAKILCSDPNILWRSLENQIIPSFNYLESFLHTNENVAFALCRTTWILHNFLKQNISLLQNHCVPKSTISKIIMINPQTLSFKPDKFRVIFMKTIEMGFDSSSLMFAHGLIMLSGMKNGTWEAKMAVYRSFGWRRTRFSLCLESNPLTTLFLSLEKRTMPRCFVFDVLLSKGLMRKENMGPALKVAEDEFLKNYVLKYQEDLPQLLKIYQTKMAGDGDNGEEEYKLWFDIPGMTKNDVKVWIEEKMLVVKAKKLPKKDKDGQENLHEEEQTTGRYSSIIALLENVEFEKIKAEVQDGVLYITIPKASNSSKIFDIDVQ
ncbi:hypothetical protein HHK36_019533 [Tetracentron sinense]|uniref:SHSP domain-containing protein n=1 Tax=Tetracentron sinense TaxID=13715 RepID=A0A835D985_TETSI|nr:hypothetical protein HHK36_019533 [Tetracentron sinense]